MKKCLLISQLKFYNMPKAIAQELGARGYDVDFLNDEYPDSLLGLVIGNFINPLSRYITFKKLSNYLSRPNKKHYDLVIIIKGRGVSPKLIELLNLHSERVVGYAWDSFGFFPGPLDWFRSVQSFKSFDYQDCEKYSLEQVDLFTEIVPVLTSSRDIDISCIVKNHSDRLLYLDKIYSHLSQHFNFYVYIYEKNILTFVRNFFQHPLLIIKWRRHINFKWLSSVDFISLMSRSKYTIDYAHHLQSGITLRCFQAVACGTRVITNNESIRKSKVFLPDQYVIFNFSNNGEEMRNHVASNLNAEQTPAYRTIVNFVDDILM